MDGKTPSIYYLALYGYLRTLYWAHKLKLFAFKSLYPLFSLYKDFRKDVHHISAVFTSGAGGWEVGDLSFFPLLSFITYGLKRSSSKVTEALYKNVRYRQETQELPWSSPPKTTVTATLFSFSVCHIT